jgi:thiamine biosynthesis lipoprotein
LETKPLIKILFWVSLSLLAACQSAPKAKTYQLQGKAQGTTYNITYYGQGLPNLQAEIDSIFAVIDASLSTYREQSTILDFNRASDSLQVSDSHFLAVLQKARQVWQQTEGAFDPTVMPLVRAWGFGPEGPQPPPGDRLDSLLAQVGFAQLKAGQDGWLGKAQPGLQLDLNAIAPGYTVDLIGEFLEGQGAEHYLVELGGEVRARGRNPQGEAWRVGIEKPQTDGSDRQLADVVGLDNACLATSGSYRKFYLRDGVKYSHTIDPQTGKPVTHNLLSVTVLAPEASLADAYATAFLVWGKEKAEAFIASQPELELEAYFIVGKEEGELETSYTAGMKELVGE